MQIKLNFFNLKYLLGLASTKIFFRHNDNFIKNNIKGIHPDFHNNIHNKITI